MRHWNFYTAEKLGKDAQNDKLQEFEERIARLEKQK
jgi:hypothetical protein